MNTSIKMAWLCPFIDFANGKIKYSLAFMHDKHTRIHVNYVHLVRTEHDDCKAEHTTGLCTVGKNWWNASEKIFWQIRFAWDGIVEKFDAHTHTHTVTMATGIDRIFYALNFAVFVFFIKTPCLWISMPFVLGTWFALIRLCNMHSSLYLGQTVRGSAYGLRVQ